MYFNVAYILKYIVQHVQKLKALIQEHKLILNLTSSIELEQEKSNLNSLNDFFTFM